MSLDFLLFCIILNARPLQEIKGTKIHQIRNETRYMAFKWL